MHRGGCNPAMSAGPPSELEVQMGMRIPPSSTPAVSSQSSVAQWQQRTQQAQIKAVVESAVPTSPPPANTGKYINLTA